MKNQEFAVNSTNSLRSNMSRFTRLILFDFSSKIYIRNSSIFTFLIRKEESSLPRTGTSLFFYFD